MISQRSPCQRGKRKKAPATQPVEWPAGLAGEGWTVRNSFGRTIDPWSPSGFSGYVDDRY